MNNFSRKIGELIFLTAAGLVLARHAAANHCPKIIRGLIQGIYDSGTGLEFEQLAVSPDNRIVLSLPGSPSLVDFVAGYPVRSRNEFRIFANCRSSSLQYRLSGFYAGNSPSVYICGLSGAPLRSWNVEEFDYAGGLRDYGDFSSLDLVLANGQPYRLYPDKFVFPHGRELGDNFQKARLCGVAGTARDLPPIIIQPDSLTFFDERGRRYTTALTFDDSLRNCSATLENGVIRLWAQSQNQRTIAVGAWDLTTGTNDILFYELNERIFHAVVQPNSDGRHAFALAGHDVVELGFDRKRFPDPVTITDRFKLSASPSVDWRSKPSDSDIKARLGGDPDADYVIDQIFWELGHQLGSPDRARRLLESLDTQMIHGPRLSFFFDRHHRNVLEVERAASASP